MIEVPLTRGYVALIDDEDISLVGTHRWYPHRTHRSIYASAVVNGQSIHMHRVIMGRLEGFQVDHIDGDGLNNQRSNLRFVTASGNQRNLRNRIWKNGVPGVTPHGNVGWTAQCTTNGRHHYLGYYRTKEDAHAAYLAHLAANDDPRHGLPLPAVTSTTQTMPIKILAEEKSASRKEKI